MMQTLLRKAAKAAVLPAGLSGRRHAGDFAVLLYHRVGAGTREIDVSRDAFQAQMETLAASGDAVSLDEALAGAGGVVVSVDDGYRDFYDVVFPRLVEYRVPAILYLTTGLVGGNGDGSESLTWSQLRDVVESGLVTVGAHTHTHVNLARVSASEGRKEMSRSKRIIEDELATECIHFAFPWSMASAQSEAAARELFKSSALLWGTNRRSRIDPHRLGRTPVLRSDGALFFKAKLDGMLDGEAAVYRVLRRGPWREQ